MASTSWRMWLETSDRLALAPQPLHEVHHAPPVHGVHAAHRLVQEQHLGLVGEGLGQLHPLAHALAVAADASVLRGAAASTSASAASARRRHSASSKPVSRSSAITNCIPVRCLPERVRAPGTGPRGGRPRASPRPGGPAGSPALAGRELARARASGRSTSPPRSAPAGPSRPGRCSTVTSLSAITGPYQREARTKSMAARHDTISTARTRRRRISRQPAARQHEDGGRGRPVPTGRRPIGQAEERAAEVAQVVLEREQRRLAAGRTRGPARCRTSSGP